MKIWLTPKNAAEFWSEIRCGKLDLTPETDLKSGKIKNILL